MPPRRSTRERKTVAEAAASAPSAAASKPVEKASSAQSNSNSSSASAERKRKRDEEDDGEEAEADAAAPEEEEEEEDEAAAEAGDDGEEGAAAAGDGLGTASEATAALEAAKAEGAAKPAKSWHHGEAQKLQLQHKHTIAFLTEKAAILTKLEAGEAVDRSHPLFLDPRTLSAPQLQDQMRLWGLVASGGRSELIKRYKNFVETGKAQNKRKKKRAVDSFDPKIEKNDPYYKHKAWLSRMYAN